MLYALYCMECTVLSELQVYCTVLSELQGEHSISCTRVLCVWDKFIESIWETESIIEQRGGGADNQIGINPAVQEIAVQCSEVQCRVLQSNAV